MPDTGVQIGIACFAGAYLMVNLANIYWLISCQKARRQEEIRKESLRDRFYDKYQTVIDLTCLINFDGDKVKKVLLDDKFKTPNSEEIAGFLTQVNDLERKKIYLTRKTHKISYDDLMMIEASLKEKKIPYVTIVRKNPVRLKINDDLLLSRECIATSRGHLHRDLKRHMASQFSIPRSRV